MKNAFFHRLIQSGTIDTRKYRYTIRVYADRLEVQRLHLDKLGTVAALTDWETVKVNR